MAIKIDWKNVLLKMAPEDRTSVIQLRSLNQDLKRQLFDIKASYPKFDWKHYKANVSNAFILAQKDKLKTFKLKSYDLTSNLELLESRREIELENVAKKLEESSKEIEKMQEELHKLENCKPLDEMTVEDYYEMYPEEKATLIDRLSKENYTINEPNYVKEESTGGH